MERLAGLGCNTNIVSTSSLYEGGLYAPYVRQVLLRHDEIMQFLTNRFHGYQPERLFWLLCPHCGYIDETQIEGVDKKEVKYRCRRCEKSGSVSLNEVKGKLNWKLDCAVRWVLLNISAEPFNKSYLEPQSGSFVVAQEISKTYFGGHDVLPLRYGLVQIDKSVSYRLLPSLPGDVLRNMFTDHATADLRITPDYVMNIASRSQVDCGLSYLECVKQLVPMWLLRQHSLTDRQRDLTARGIRFAEDFLNHQVALRLPSRASMQDIHPDILSDMHRLMVDVLRLREHHGDSYAAFCEPAKQLMASLGENKHEIMVRLRAILGQKQGLPASRLLFLMSLDYLQALEYMLELRVGHVEETPLLLSKLAA